MVSRGVRTTMSDPFRMYEAARKHMYTAMEREADPPAARRGYEQALDGFDEFLGAAAKNRGMYRELVRPARGCAPRAPTHPVSCARPACPARPPVPDPRRSRPAARRARRAWARARGRAGEEGDSHEGHVQAQA